MEQFLSFMDIFDSFLSILNWTQSCPSFGGPGLPAVHSAEFFSKVATVLEELHQPNESPGNFFPAVQK